MTGTSLMVSTSALVGRDLSERALLATIPLGLQFLFMTLAATPASLLMQRVGRGKGFMVAAVLGMAGAATATWSIMAGSYIGFCVGSMLLGTFNGFGQFYRFAAVEAVPSDYGSRAISWVLAGGIVAGFLGPNIAAWTRPLLGAEFAGSYGVLIAMYAVSLIAAAALTIPVPSAEERESRGRPLAEIVGQPRFLLAVAAATVGYGVMNLLMVATPLAMESRGYGFEDTAFVIQWHVVAMFLPSFFTGNLIKRLGVFTVLGAGALLALATVAVNLSGETPWHFWAALVCLGAGWNFLFIGGTTLLTETYAPEERAKCQALNDVVVFGTVTLTALGSGVLFEGLGWRWMNLATLAPLAAVLAGIVLVRLRHAQAQPATS
ncbi:MFS transporter [Ectothiorhodospiraceae bacterium WFHF3C12]|nr:MFS transporter [Ectothiorhodospiraceae bacterium WFHF3C12]